MKTTSKKIATGLAVIALIASIGVIFVSAQTNGTGGDNSQQRDFWGRNQMNGPAPFCSDDTVNSTNQQKPFFGRQQMNESMFFCYNLTEEQQTNLQELITTLTEQGSNASEIRIAINEKLDEYGVFDIQLDSAINNTKQRLDILNREKELRNQGYSWDKINEIIQNEFGIKAPVGANQDMMFEHGFGRETGQGPRDFMSDKKPIK